MRIMRRDIPALAVARPAVAVLAVTGYSAVDARRRALPARAMAAHRIGMRRFCMEMVVMGMVVAGMIVWRGNTAVRKA